MIQKILKLFFIIVTLSTLIVSCAHKEIIGNLINKIPDYKNEFDFSNPRKVREYLQKISNLNKPDNQQKLIQILIAFNTLKYGLSESTINIPPNSKTHIEITSFCASAEKAIPEQKEIFQWVKGLPKIPLAKEVLILYAKKPEVEASKIQELLWNLGNKTYYEDYPDSLKKLITQLSPTAPLTLPSRIKSQIVDEFTPQEIKDTINTIQGKYQSFNDFKKLIESKKSNLIFAQGNFISELPDTNILAATISNGFGSQIITFYNPSSNVQSFKATEYFLKPYREDVQPIVLASVLPNNNEIQKILEEYALKLLGYLGSQYPTLIPQEKELVKQKPIEAAIAYYSAFIAERAGNNFYPDSSENGPSDAFRHFTWAGLLTRDLGEVTARQFLKTHELKSNQPLEEKAMDEFNNEHGIAAANQLLKKGNFQNTELYEKATEEVKHDKLRILNHEKQDKRY